MSEWQCQACTLLNQTQAIVCAACGIVKEEEEVGVECLICTYQNQPDATVCVMCKGDLIHVPSTKSSSNSKQAPVVVAMSMFSSASLFHKKRKLQPEAISSNFMKASDIINDINDPLMKDEGSKSLSTVSEFDMYEEDSQGTGEPEAKNASHEHDDEIITISDSDESLGEESVHEDEIEEFSEDSFFNVAQPPDHLPGVVEVAPTHPTLTKHYWSVKHLESLKVCNINFKDFTLDSGESSHAAKKHIQSSADNTDYDKRRRSREVKEQKKKQKRKEQFSKNKDKIAKRIAKAKAKAAARRGY